MQLFVCGLFIFILEKRCILKINGSFQSKITTMRINIDKADSLSLVNQIHNKI